MQISLTLNGKAEVFNASPDESLLQVLRSRQLYKVKCGCMEGHCGNCMVLIDNKPTPSCVVPVAAVRESNVVTLEHFITYPEYNDIMSGFKQAGVNLCGYCDAGKILTAYQLITPSSRPSVPQIVHMIKDLDFCCTDRNSYINGILYAIATKHRREGKKNGRK
jgi:carbon-monoxide dehydrogenase small subunit